MTDLTVKDRLFQLLALWSLAVSGPLLKVLGTGGEFFVNHRNSGFEIAAIASLLTVLPPAFLLLIECLLQKISTAAAVVFKFIVNSVLLFLGITAIGVTSAVPGLPLIIISGLLATGIAFSLFKINFINKIVKFLACFALISIASFLTSSKIRSILFRSGAILNVAVQEDKSTTPVVVIVFDEFSVSGLMTADRNIDALRYPNFANLSKNGYWFRNATAVNQFTPLAVPAVLSGLLPHDESRMPISEHYPFSLFTSLSNSHEMQVDEPFTDLCPRTLCPEGEEKKVSIKMVFTDLAAVYLSIVAPPDLDLGNPSIDGKWGDFWSGENQEESWNAPKFGVVSRAVRAKRSVQNWKLLAKPSLYFLHTLIPHMPMEFMPTIKAYKRNTLRAYDNNQWLDLEYPRQLSYARYLMQVGAADTLLGMAVAKLKELGIYDQSLIVVTADHGVSFQAGTYRRGHPNHPDFYEDILNVPLFIKLPNQTAGGIRDENAEVIDILPTILDQLKIKFSAKLDGHSLISGQPLPQKHAFMGRNPTGRARTQANWGAEASGMRVINFPVELKNSTLKWKWNIPGMQNPPPSDLFYVGPRSDMVGKEVAAFSITEALKDSSWKISGSKRVHKAGAYEFTYKSDPDTCPCHIMGEIFGSSLKSKSLVVVAVNDIIRAVTPLGERKNIDSSLKFDVIVPENIYQDGKNTIKVYELKNDSLLVPIVG